MCTWRGQRTQCLWDRTPASESWLLSSPAAFGILNKNSIRTNLYIPLPYFCTVLKLFALLFLKTAWLLANENLYWWPKIMEFSFRILHQIIRLFSWAPFLQVFGSDPELDPYPQIWIRIQNQLQTYSVSNFQFFILLVFWVGSGAGSISRSGSGSGMTCQVGSGSGINHSRSSTQLLVAVPATWSWNSWRRLPSRLCRICISFFCSSFILFWTLQNNPKLNFIGKIWDGSHRDKFGESLEDFVSCRVTVVGYFLGYRILNPYGLAYGFLRGWGCLFTFFTFIHILLMALIFVSFYKYIDESDSKNQQYRKIYWIPSYWV